MRTIAAIPTAALLAGAAFGLYLPESSPTLAFVLMSISVACAMFAWALERRRLLIVSVSIGFFTGGWLLSAVEWQRAWRPPLRVAFEQLARVERDAAAAQGRRMPEDDEAFAIVEGVLRADAALSDAGVSLSVAVDGLEAPAGSTPQIAGGILVTVVGSLAAVHIDEWRAGRRVRMPVMLRRPSRYLNPGVPDHERALARRGTTLVGSVKSGALVEVLSRGSTADEAMGAARAFARRAIATNVGQWNPQSAAIVAAIVIGDRAGLDDDVQRRLQEAGTYHVIAISGGNIAILAGLLLGAFRRAGLLGRTAMLSAIVMLTGYGRLVGGGASVDRATLMAAVYFGARAFDQRTPPLNALAVVAGLIVAADPLAVADPAFLLTFGATLAIVLVMPAIATTAAERGTSMRILAAMLAASIAAEAVLFPIGAIVFSRVTFAGLGLNFLAVPLMGVAQIAGLALVPLAMLSTTLASGAGWIAHVGAAGLVWSAQLVRLAPVVTYRVAPPDPVVVIIYYGALAGWWVSLSRPRSSTGARGFSRALALLATASALWILVDPRVLVAARGDGRLHVTFIDVGQGDAIFVRFPRGSTLLVDAGGLAFSSSFDVGDRVVAPVIRDAGFRRLDLVALTHGDPDHIGGAASIVGEFRPREVWEGIPVPRSPPLTTLRTLTESIGSRWANVYARDRTVVDDVEIVARHPEVADWERQKVRNDDSLVLELRWRDVSVLLTGDIGREIERDLATAIPRARLRVMKVPHHGSLTSSSADFVTAMKPTVAVVSVGRGNHFGHPVPEVVARYRAVGAEIFRTDRDGAVTVETDGRAIEVHTFSGRRLSLD